MDFSPWLHRIVLSFGLEHSVPEPEGEGRSLVLFQQEGCTKSTLGSGSSLGDGSPFIGACLVGIRVCATAQDTVWGHHSESGYLLNTSGDWNRLFPTR